MKTFGSGSLGATLGMVALAVVGSGALWAQDAASKNTESPTYAPVQPEPYRLRGGLPNVLAKLTAGHEVRIAYLEGSITQMEGWRDLMHQWFQTTYSRAKVSQINAGLGGSGCTLGVFRAGREVLAHKPDLVFVEFAVNDQGTPPEDIWRAMEGIVRQIWRADPLTDICFFYTLHGAMLSAYVEGYCPRSVSAMEGLADDYAIPSINGGWRVVRLASEGKLLFREGRA